MHCEGRPLTKNPNESWLSTRGAWVSWIGVVVVLHFILLSIPGLTVPVAWTLTNIIHAVLMFYILHTIKGSPFGTNTDGTERTETHWEQIDSGKQLTETKKFLTVFPIILFLLASFYTEYSFQHFVPNFAFMLLATVPKLPSFHGVRLFGINKY